MLNWQKKKNSNRIRRNNSHGDWSGFATRQFTNLFFVWKIHENLTLYPYIQKHIFLKVQVLFVFLELYVNSRSTGIVSVPYFRFACEMRVERKCYLFRNLTWSQQKFIVSEPYIYNIYLLFGKYIAYVRRGEVGVKSCLTLWWNFQ